MVEVIAVVGACAPERHRYAQALAAATDRQLIPARRLAFFTHPVEEAAAMAPWADAAAGVVVEFPIQAPAVEIIGALADPAAPTRLRAVVCVVDAAHLLEDLRADDYVPRPAGSPPGARIEHTAWAMLAVAQIEYASVLAVVNAKGLAPADRSTVLALLHHLSPLARIQIDDAGDDDVAPVPIPEVSMAGVYTAEQERPGWVELLNGSFLPSRVDPRVSALRYEQVRPFHPGRLQRLLDTRIETGEFGVVVRSAGFCRLATRPFLTAQWEHVGHMFSLEPVADDDRFEPDDEVLSIGQDLAVIGLDLDRDGLVAALDEAALTDDEFVAGPMTWATLGDPFPAWPSGSDRAE